MASTETSSPTPPAARLSPGQSIQAQPWAFVGMALAVGVAAGMLWRVKAVRKALRLYLLVRRFV
ncbi:MAG TPA: hypothetical protein VNZ22_02855 [Bacillota bacterium]|nr:hypothetical protein [Bacillota bacterium]